MDCNYACRNPRPHKMCAPPELVCKGGDFGEKANELVKCERSSCTIVKEEERELPAMTVKPTCHIGAGDARLSSSNAAIIATKTWSGSEKPKRRRASPTSGRDKEPLRSRSAPSKCARHVPI